MRTQFVINFYYEGIIMSKGKDQKRDAKKPAKHSLKEKRAAKKEKQGKNK